MQRQHNVTSKKTAYNFKKTIAVGIILQIQKSSFFSIFTIDLANDWNLWVVRKSGTLCLMSSKLLQTNRGSYMSAPLVADIEDLT